MNLHIFKLQTAAYTTICCICVGFLFGTLMKANSTDYHDDSVVYGCGEMMLSQCPLINELRLKILESESRLPRIQANEEKNSVTIIRREELFTEAGINPNRALIALSVDLFSVAWFALSPLMLIGPKRIWKRLDNCLTSWDSAICAKL